MRRVLRCDGILPTILDENKKFTDLTPEHVREIGEYVDQNRRLDSPFDIVVENTSPGDDPTAAAEKVQSWIEAGATWWIESMWGEKDSEKWRERLQQGPPKV
jgi:hypothetical protein